MGAKLNLRWLESRQTYRDYLFALTDKRQRGPGKPLIVTGADDMASHRTGRDVVVWPESIGLFAALTGPRAEPARRSGSLEGAVAALAASYAPQNAYYGERYPDLPARSPFTRLLGVSLTDTFGRTFIEPFAELADRYDVWLVTVGDMVREWRIVCTSRASFKRPPGARRCDQEDPAKVQQLRDPSEPERDYAYEATSPNVAVQTFVFDPDGRLVAQVPKSYLTPTELGQDEGEVGLDLVPGKVSDSDARPLETPVGTLGFVVSKPAWMPDVVQKLDQAHADVLVQPEFFSENLVAAKGMWQPDALLASGYSALLRQPSFEYLVHPQLQGGVFKYYADHPTHLAAKPRTGTEPGAGLLGQPAHPGLDQVLPWVVPDELRPGEPVAERRARLADAGAKLAPGSGVECPDPAKPGPCEDGHNEGVLWRDVVVNRTPAYTRYRGPLRRTRFSAARPLAPSRRPQRNVAVSVLGTRVAVAYEQRHAGHDQIFLLTSDDGGRSWAKPVRPTGRPAGSTDEWWPAVALGPKGRLTVAWTDRSTGRERIYYSRSRNGGRRFGRPVALDPGSPADTLQWKPALAADDRGRDLVHAVFVDERERSRPGGLPQAHVYYTRIVAGRAAKSRRLDTGEAQPRARKLDHSWAPTVASRGERVLVAWLDFLRFDWDVFARASSDRGETFGPQRDVNDAPELSDPNDPSKPGEALAGEPRATVSAGRDLVTWTDWREREDDYRRPHQLYDTYISEPGAGNVQVDPYAARQVSTFAPDVCAAGRGDALVAFQDTASGQSDIRAAYVKGGTQPGYSYRVDDAGSGGDNAWRPRLACRRDQVLAFWEDERDGPAQIYYARSTMAKLR